MSPKEEKVRQVVAGVKVRVRGKLSDLWWTFMLRGLLALALAACALFWPQKTMDILIKLLGAYFVFDGAMGAIGAFRSGSKGAYPQAIVSLAAGLALLFWTEISAKLFLVVVGVWALLQGVGVFLSRKDVDPENEAGGLMAVLGTVLVLVGLVFIFWPDTGVVAVSWLISIGALVVAGLLLYLATLLKRAKRRIDSLGQGGP